VEQIETSVGEADPEAVRFPVGDDLRGGLVVYDLGIAPFPPPRTAESWRACTTAVPGLPTAIPPAALPIRAAVLTERERQRGDHCIAGARDVENFGGASGNMRNRALGSAGSKMVMPWRRR
jgi:hypothetical protein